MQATSIIVILLFVYTIFSGASQEIAPRQSVLENFLTREAFIAPVGFYESANEQNVQAIRSFIRNNSKKVSDEESEQIFNSIINYCEKYDVNPMIVAALIYRESGFDPMSQSSSNAQGLGQLLPSTAQSIGITDPFDIDEGVKGCVMYFKMMLDKWIGYPNRIELALASYAEGPNQVVKNNGNYSDKTAKYISDIYKIYKSIK